MNSKPGEGDNDNESRATPPAASSGIQGEGDYDAARRYRNETEAFVDQANVEQLARDAAPHSAAEGRDLARAEDQGKARSKGDDPADANAMYPKGDPGRPGR